MFKRQPSKVFMNKDQLTVMKVNLQVHPNFFLIVAKSVHIEIRLIVLKSFELTEGYRYRFMLNDIDMYELQNELVYTYQGKNLFHDSVFRVRKDKYHFHSGILELSYPSPREIYLSFKALLQKDGAFTEDWFQLNPVLSEVESGLDFDFPRWRLVPADENIVKKVNSLRHPEVANQSLR